MVHMHRQENSQALRCWLQVLEADPKNRKAQKGLNLLKSSYRQEDLNDLLEEGRLDRLLPERKKSVRVLKPLVLILVGVFVLAMAAAWGIRNYQRFLPDRRKDYQEISAEDFPALLDSSQTSLFILTRDDLQKTLDRINESFVSYHDNPAMRDINRILLSNAHQDIKTRVSLLEKNIRVPSFADFQDNFSYREVREEPLLYRNCYVLWKGRATNVLVGQSDIRFDFLVDYQDEKQLSGIVPVVLNFSAEVTPDYPMEILARVVPSHSGDFTLEGVSLRRLW